MIFYMASMQSEKEKERKEIKKRRVILGQTTIHVPSREEEDAETNQMMR
jgi:hypothetical protein